MIKRAIERWRQKKREHMRKGCLVETFYQLSFRRPIWKGDDNRCKWIIDGLDCAANDLEITLEERDALKAYVYFKIYKKVPAELVSKADQTIVYRLMEEVGFTYV